MFSSLLRIISIHNKNKFVLHSFVIYSTFDCRDFIILHILAIFNQCFKFLQASNYAHTLFTATLTKQLDDEDKVDCVELNLEKNLEIG